MQWYGFWIPLIFNFFCLRIFPRNGNTFRWFQNGKRRFNTSHNPDTTCFCAKVTGKLALTADIAHVRMRMNYLWIKTNLVKEAVMKRISNARFNWLIAEIVTRYA